MLVLKHLTGIVNRAVAGGLRADQGAAVGQALAGDHAVLKCIRNTLILTKQEADLPGAYANVAGRHIHTGADMPVQLRHKRLAKAHNLTLALASRVKVRAALSAAHRQAGQAVLERLFKPKEIHNTGVHAGMEPQAALIRANG